jgi:phosphopantetheine--protein transferase-like protein
MATLKNGSFGNLNVGIDIIEIERFRNKPLCDGNSSFYNAILTEKELIYCMKFSDPYPHIAGIFAAKESLIKCLSRPIRMTEVEISHNRGGKPLITLRSKKKSNMRARISITHTKSIAIAVAITS